MKGKESRDEVGGGDDQSRTTPMQCKCVHGTDQVHIVRPMQCKLRECLTPELDACAACVHANGECFFLRVRGKTSLGGHLSFNRI